MSSAQNANDILRGEDRKNAAYVIRILLIVSGAGTLILGMAGLFGLFFGIVPLSSVFSGYRPIALSAALIWCFFGLVLIFCCKRPFSRIVKVLLGTVTAFIAVAVAIEFPLGFLGRHSFIESFINTNASHFVQTALVPISPLAALMILPAAIGLFLLIVKKEYPDENKNEHSLIGIFGVFCLLAGFLFIASYLYQMPFFYGTSILPIAFTSALAGLFVGVGMIAAAGPAVFPLVYFSGPSTRARLLRFFVPFTITLVLIQNQLSILLLSIFHVNQAIELSLTLILFCVIASWGVTILAGSIGHTIDRERELRAQAEEELRQNYDELNTTYELLTSTEEELRGNYEELAGSQKKLQESEERLRLFIRHAPAALAMFDREMRYLVVSQKWMTDYQLKDQQLIGRSHYEIFPEITDEWKAVHRRGLAGEVVTAQEDRFVRGDGTVQWLSWEVRPWYTSDHAIGGIVIFSEDITWRKQAEMALGESRTKLAAALASMTDAVFISDTEGKFIEFNDAFATFHRFKNKAECATTLAEYPAFLDVLMADGTPAPLDMWAVPRALQGETGTNVEFALKRKDTGETWVGSYSYSPIRDVTGRIVGSVVTGRDITEKKKAEQELQEKHAELNAAYEQLTSTEEELRQNYEQLEASERALRSSEQRLRRFYESGLFGVIFWTTTGKITDANDKFLSMTGYTREDLLADRIDWGAMTPDEFREQDEKSLEELRERGVNRAPFEKEYFRKDGTCFPVLIAGAMLDDHFLEGVAFVLDISERKTAEAALKKSEEQYRSLFENMQEGLAHCRMLYDNDGQPVDFVYLAVNHSFDRIIGAGTVIGKPVTEVFPGIRTAFPQLFEIYGRVARTGNPESFDIEFSPS
ncbi:putative PAS/PAC sensor protein [Methanoregula boonei 6A8]|uniref:Putative PAS/PAC sensor protein n=1 Tax=Methanoregula boonei (strain DSM 21154 / JCM 14090 / 6A8) TaxID=456442 RepID=A7I9B4_METB6|nr:PAS domain S-box protein [Methanoregula boonei]ABS56325.1 putative PAS/PAC sensor protein [Methanoregula boonei 6A8]